jgi:hypothetical protein
VILLAKNRHNGLCVLLGWETQEMHSEFLMGNLQENGELEDREMDEIYICSRARTHIKMFINGILKGLNLQTQL